MAYIAYYFHWPHDEILRLEHLERRRWVAEIAELHERLRREEANRPSLNR